MEAASERDEAARIALADRMKIAGQPREELARAGGWPAPRAHPGEEGGVRAGDPGLGGASGRSRPAAVAAHRELARADGRSGARTWDRDFLLDQTKNGPKPLDLALTLARWAGEKAKPGPGARAGLPGAQPRAARPSGWSGTRSGSIAPPRRALLADVLARFAALPEGSRVPAVEALPRRRPARTPRHPRPVDALLARTSVTDLAERQRDVRGERGAAPRPARPAARPRLRAGRRAAALKERERPLRGRRLAAAPALAAGGDRPTPAARWPRTPTARCASRSPTSRATARATACGCSPQTTVAGMVEKHTGEEPFNAPAGVLAAAPQARAEPLGRPEAEGRAGRLPGRRRHHGRQLGQPGGQRPRRAGGRQLRPRLGERGQRLRLQPGRGAERQRRTSATCSGCCEALHGEAAGPLLREMGVATRN